MHVGIIGHREARLHGAKVMPSLDLRHGQGHRCAAVNAMEGDFLDARLNFVHAVVEERSRGVDGHHSRICCQLGVIQLHRQGWQS